MASETLEGLLTALRHWRVSHANWTAINVADYPGREEAYRRDLGIAYNAMKRADAKLAEAHQTYVSRHPKSAVKARAASPLLAKAPTPPFSGDGEGPTCDVCGQGTVKSGKTLRCMNCGNVTYPESNA